MRENLVLSLPEIFEEILLTPLLILLLVSVLLGLLFGWLKALSVRPAEGRTDFWSSVVASILCSLFYALLGGTLGAVIGKQSIYGSAPISINVNNTGWGDPKPFLLILFILLPGVIGTIVGAIIGVLSQDA